MTLSVGPRLGPTEIIGAFGSGGSGEADRGRDPTLNREVAVKVRPPATAKWSAHPGATPASARGLLDQGRDRNVKIKAPSR